MPHDWQMTVYDADFGALAWESRGANQTRKIFE